MEVVPSTEYLHTVNDEGRHYTVSLLEKKCSCGRFQIDELPCPHAWAILKRKFLMPEDFCSDYYKPKFVVMTYEVLVYPLPDRKEWNIPAHVADEVVLPPKWKRPPGRPKKKRISPSLNCCRRKINIRVAYVDWNDIISVLVEMLHVEISSQSDLY
ncbi:uncharacterized protein LOC107788148 [Nicotiana tabacum]|uniref:Uncharacterized protein LOC107788148 n=1 Tax=Nicotiana tabacum TaxID=4097 RepID=A0A1S3ZLN7_TOBAC|nr:PREDICTED: uncharacterized protein LOC107788148 [Nicotiana tabacum]